MRPNITKEIGFNKKMSSVLRPEMFSGVVDRSPQEIKTIIEKDEEDRLRSFEVEIALEEGKIEYAKKALFQDGVRPTHGIVNKACRKSLDIVVMLFEKCPQVFYFTGCDRDPTKRPDAIQFLHKQENYRCCGFSTCPSGPCIRLRENCVL